MSILPSPQPPQYRVTLFYGPEPVEGTPKIVQCVFNVKKRSWKGGVQVAVELDEAQVSHATQALGFEAWLREVLAPIAEAERSDYASRAQDLFVQGLSTVKLDLAIEAGIRQENGRVPAEAFANELGRAVAAMADCIKAQILAELDLASHAK